MQQRLKQNTYFISAGLILQMVMALALVPFAARYLGDDRYGQYGLASTIMFFVFLFNDLGVNTYLTREVARYRDQASQFVSNALVLKLILILANSLLLFVFLWLSGYDESTKIAILIFALYGFLTSFVKLGIGIFEAFERMEFETIILIIEKSMITFLGIYFLVTGKGLYVLCAVFVFSGVLSCLLTYWFMHKKFVSLKITYDFVFIKELIKNSLPFGYSMILAMVYNYVGIIMLSFLKSDAVLGWYFAAFRLLSQTNIFPTILVTSMFPALSRAYIHSQEKFQEWFTKGLKYLLFLAFPLIAGTSLLASPVVLLVFGSNFVNTIPVLKILAWTAGILFFNIYFGGIFKAANRQKLLVKIQVVSLVVNVCLNFVLIQRYSYIGAAWANLLTEIMIFIVCFVYISVTISRIQEISFFFKSILATGSMVAFIWFFPGLNVILLIAASVMIYFGALYILKGFTLSELLLLKQGAYENS